MAFQAAPSCASVAAVMTLNGEQIVNRFVFHNPDAWGAGDLQALTVAFNDKWEAGVMPGLSYQTSVLVYEGRGLRSVGDVSYDFSPAVPVVGGAAGDCEDNAVAICYKLATGLAGRSFRGRTYIGGVPANKLDNNRIALDLLAAVNVGLNGLVGAGAVESGWSLVVLSRRAGGELRPFAVNTPVNAILSTSQIAASQRRRRPKRT